MYRRSGGRQPPLPLASSTTRTWATLCSRGVSKSCCPASKIAARSRASIVARISHNRRQLTLNSSLCSTPAEQVGSWADDSCECFQALCSRAYVRRWTIAGRTFAREQHPCRSSTTIGADDCHGSAVRHPTVACPSRTQVQWHTLINCARAKGFWINNYFI